jgi:hypothetical protein
MNRRSIITISAGAVLGLATLPCSAVAQQKSLKEQLIGTWTLVSNVQTRPDGSKLEPFTTNPKGVWTFDANGHFTTITLRPDVPKLASNDRLKLTPEEAMKIALGVIAYYGTYTVDEANKTLSLKIDASTLMNQLGIEQKRVVTSISAEGLEMRNPSGVEGSQFALVLKRAK